MHTILFDNYRKHQREIRGNIVKAFKKLPIPAIIILSTITATIVYAILSIFIECLQQWYIWCLLLEVLAGIVLFFYTEYYQINTSSTRLQDYKKYCGELLEWLRTTGLIINEKNLKEIISRINRDVKLLEEKRLKRRDRIEKWIQILIIPILLAIFSEIIREKTDISVLITYALVLLVSLGSVAVAFLCCYNIVDFFQKRKLEQLKSFSKDLQGVIDTHLEKKLLKDNRKRLLLNKRMNDNAIRNCKK